MDQNTIIASIALISSVATFVFGAINHKRIRSNCCGKLTVSSIDIENTTPPISSRRGSIMVAHQPQSLEIRVPDQDV